MECSNEGRYSRGRNDSRLDISCLILILFNNLYILMLIAVIFTLCLSFSFTFIIMTMCMCGKQDMSWFIIFIFNFCWPYTSPEDLPSSTSEFTDRCVLAHRQIGCWWPLTAHHPKANAYQQFLLDSKEYKGKRLRDLAHNFLKQCQLLVYDFSTSLNYLKLYFLFPLTRLHKVDL